MVQKIDLIKIPEIPIQKIFETPDVSLDILREDLNHPLIQGNKLRKLKYNLIEARKLGKTSMLTFGGAYSNHIYATAAAGKAFGFNTVGIIRGEELASKPLNATLRAAQDFGMKLVFISRQDYRQKHTEMFLNSILQKYPKAYILPEGGTNALAVEGCEEILDDRTKTYDFICLGVGTGGTIAGIINASQQHQKVLGFPALKGAEFLYDEIAIYTQKSNYDLINAYHFGGYAKFSSELISFVNQFGQEFQIPLDPVYNGKMMFGVLDMIQKQAFPKGARVLAIHTGGHQGIVGFNERNGQLIKV